MTYRLQTAENGARWSKARSINDCQSDVPNDSWDGNVSHPGDDDAGDGDLDAGPLEEFIAEVDAVPKRDDVPLDRDVVLPVQPVNERADQFYFQFVLA